MVIVMDAEEILKPKGKVLLTGAGFTHNLGGVLGSKRELLLVVKSHEISYTIYTWKKLSGGL